MIDRTAQANAANAAKAAGAEKVLKLLGKSPFAPVGRAYIDQLGQLEANAKLDTREGLEAQITGVRECLAFINKACQAKPEKPAKGQKPTPVMLASRLGDAMRLGNATSIVKDLESRIAALGK